MIRVVAKFLFQPDRADEATEIARELIDLTRKEAGCVQYNLVQSVENKDLLVVLEEWETQAHLDNHSASKHFGELVPKLAAMCVEPPVVDIFTLLI